MSEEEESSGQSSGLELAAFALIGIVAGFAFWFVMTFLVQIIFWADGSHQFGLTIYYLVMTALVGAGGIWVQMSRRFSRRVRMFLSFFAFTALGMFCICDIFFVGALSNRNN